MGHRESSSTRDGGRKESMCLVEHLRIQAVLTPDPGQSGQGEVRGRLTASLPPMERISS